MIEVDRLKEPWEGDAIEILRWYVGDATVLRIGDVDAAAAL